MNTIKQLCLAYKQRRLNSLEFITFITRELWMHKDDDSFCDKIAESLYYSEPSGGDGE